MSGEIIYTYIVIKPIRDYGFNLEIGDLITTKDLQSIPPMYRKYNCELLDTPVVKGGNK